MIHPVFLLFIGLVALTGPLLADAFIPEEFGPVSAHAVGVVVLNPDLQHFLGRTGEPDSESAFSTAGQSYRWIYLLGSGNETSSMLLRGVQPGDVYSPLGAKMPTVGELLAASIIQKSHTLVEADVNEGLGSGQGDRLVLTNIKRLDGSPGHPIDTDAVVEKSRAEYARLGTTDLEAAMEKARVLTKTPPPPWAVRLGAMGTSALRDSRELTYVTWLPERKALEIRFRRIAIDARSVPIDATKPPAPQAGQAAPDAAPDPVDLFHHTQWAAQRDVTFTWKAGRLEKTVTAPVLFHYEHRDEGATAR